MPPAIAASPSPGATPASRAASPIFSPAWWNAGDCGGFDLTDLWNIDRAIAEEILAVARLIAIRHEYPTAQGYGPQCEQLVADWRSRLLDRPEASRA